MTFRDSVSRAERRVLDALLEGLPNKAIANRLGVSESTIKLHIKSMCIRSGAMNRTGLVLAASDGFAGQIAEMKDKVAQLTAENAKLRQMVLEKTAEVQVLERLLVKMAPAAAQIATKLTQVAA